MDRVHPLGPFPRYKQLTLTRVGDVELYRRAPWDPALAALLLREPAAREAALGYISGFTKINNPGRFQPDVFEAEGSRFDRSYRPIAQIDRQRIEFLYPEETGAAVLEDSPYLDDFEELIQEVRARGSRFIVVRPPVPQRIYEMLPGEAARAQRPASLHPFSHRRWEAIQLS